MSHLLDTCVLSEYAKKSPDASVLAWLDALPEAGLYISAVSLAEIEKGVMKLAVNPQETKRAQALTAWLAKVTGRFATRTLPVDAAVWRVWAGQSAAAELAGQPISPLDGLIMATAHCNGLAIVTRNTADFARYPLVVNPWSPA